MSKPTALIIEHDFTGHRWRYVEWAVQAYTEAGYHCMVVTDPGNQAHPLAQRMLAAQDAAAGNGPPGSPVRFEIDDLGFAVNAA